MQNAECRRAQRLARMIGVARCPGPRVAIAAVCLSVVAVTAGCGRKGPPLVPLVRIPAPVDDLTLRRIGNDVYLTFTVPSRNVDGSAPPALTHVELLALDAPASPAPQDFGRDATRVAVVAVSLPPPDGGAEPAIAGSAAAPGERVTVRETLDPAARDVGRYYLARAYGPRDRTSPAARVSELPAGPAPAAPDGLTLTFSADATTLTWSASPEASAYHVYAVAPAAPDAAPREDRPREPPMPLTSPPIETTMYSEPVRFGVERCYAVRSVSPGTPAIESAASAATCITPQDIFPPGAPTELTAVAGPDGIALRWTPSPEPDVAGYVVLRGTTADDTLLPITDVPVAEPRLLDRDVVSGVRYVYAVVAVDTRQPVPNRSPESRRDAVTAR